MLRLHNVVARWLNWSRFCHVPMYIIADRQPLNREKTALTLLGVSLNAVLIEFPSSLLTPRAYLYVHDSLVDSAVASAPRTEGARAPTIQCGPSVFRIRGQGDQGAPDP